MKLQTSILLCFIFGLLLSGCIKTDMCGEPVSGSVLDNLDSLGLPPATTTGENTFGCLVNGEPWLPLKRNIFGTLSYQIDFSTGTSSPGYFTCLMVQSYDSLESYIQFSVLDVFNEGIYFNTDLTDGGEFSSDGDINIDTSYEIDLSYQESEVIITRLDSIAEIISGTFNLRYIKVTDSDTLMVTEGRFDLKGN